MEVVSSTRKREVERGGCSSIRLTLCEQLVILLKTRKELKYLCNNVSLSLRVCMVAELAMLNAIHLVGGKVVPKEHRIDLPLYVEAVDKIHAARLTPKELVYALNGERAIIDIHLKDVRAKVYRMLENKGICKVESGSLLFKKIVVGDYNAKSETIDYVRNHLARGNVIDYRAEVLIVCLIFCHGINGILVCMSEKEATAADAQIRRIKNKYLGQTDFDSDLEAIIFPILRSLLS
jgi:golgi phosphoprotein 3